MERNFAGLIDRKFDLLVCGGGIYGAWTAYDAALRGLSVAIVEKDDWASATSSASTKLIHGGLRYLESLNFKLVRKSLLERQMLIQSAPHRVWPLRFGIPVYSGQRVGSWRLKAGLMLYDRLAAIREPELKHKKYSREDFVNQFPYLRAENLITGFSYVDAQTDDARFVLEIIAGAINAGVVCVNYCRVMRYREQQGRVETVELQDALSGQNAVVRADSFVNATGQWTNKLLREGAGSDYCRLSKGVHLLMPSLGGSDALLVFAQSDNRIFFMLPWYGLTLIGTTDTNFSGDIDGVNVNQPDVSYLLSEANRVLVTVHWTESDIIGRFVGLRVLKNSNKQSSYNVDRDWELKELDNGVLASIGGKLTSAREDAMVIVDRICEKLCVKQSSSTWGKAFPWAPNQTYNDWYQIALSEGENLGLERNESHNLISRHGDNAKKVLDLIKNNPGLRRPIFPDCPFIIADLLYCAENEMVVHLEDLLRRRLPLLITRKIKMTELQEMAVQVGPILDWNPGRIEKEIKSCADKWQIH